MSGGKGGGGGDSQTTTVQKADPWSGQQPYLRSGFQRADQLYMSGGPQFYPGATYVPFSPQTEAGLDLMTARSAGSPAEQAMGGYLTNSLNGQFLNANPWLDAMYGNAANRLTEQFTNAVMPGINATFGGAGRTGSGIHSQTVTDAAGKLGYSLTDLANQVYGGNYQAERDRMTQAAQLVPQSSALDWNNLQQLMGVGGKVEGKAGEILGDSMNRFNWYQNLPEQNLQRYIAAIQGNYGGMTSGTQETESKSGGFSGGGAIGGALAGAKLGSIVPGLGTGIGAILGALGGGFF